MCRSIPKRLTEWRRCTSRGAGRSSLPHGIRNPILREDCDRNVPEICAAVYKRNPAARAALSPLLLCGCLAELRTAAASRADRRSPRANPAGRTFEGCNYLPASAWQDVTDLAPVRRVVAGVEPAEARHLLHPFSRIGEFNRGTRAADRRESGVSSDLWCANHGR